MDINTIKEYMVELGFSVDKEAYKKTQEAVEKLHENLEKHAKGMIASFTKALGIYIAGITTLTTASLSLIHSLHEADVGYQKFALHMYMNTKAAKDLKQVLDVMGESLEDVIWIDSLNKRAKALLEWKRQIGDPKDYKETMEATDRIATKWDMFRLSITKFWEFLGSALYKSGVLKTVESFLDKVNNWFLANYDRIAKFFSIVLAEGIKQLDTLVWAFKKVYELLKAGVGWLYDKWDKLPANVKQYGIIAGLLIGGGYMMWFHPIMFLVGLFVLLNKVAQDWRNWSEGKASSSFLAGLWQQLEWFKQDPSNRLRDWWARFVNIFAYYLGYLRKKFSDWGEDLLTLIDDLATRMGQAIARGIEREVGKALPLWLQHFLERREEQRKYHEHDELHPGGTWDPNKDEYGSPKSEIRRQDYLGASTYSGDFLERIAANESKGWKNPYEAHPPAWTHSHAFGKYQIMPKTWRLFAPMAGLSPFAPMTKENQERVASTMKNYYANKYHNQDDLMAVAWFGGEGIADKIAKGDTSIWNKPLDAFGTTPRKYVNMYHNAQVHIHVYGVHDPVATGKAIKREYERFQEAEMARSLRETQFVFG